MSKPKIMAFYLPQFHETEYNSKWWGEGFTDWVSVRGSKPVYKGQRQPRVPLDGNYYDLADESATTLKWQADLAREYGVYGFCIYHYWFAGQKFLDKPVDILLSHPEIDIHFSLCWDSGTWQRNWYVNKYEHEILVQQDYGDREMWERHFNDLLPAFMDDRYIKIDNKPVFHIYKSIIIPCLSEMKACWDEMAQKSGFDGVYLVVGDSPSDARKQLLDTVDAFYNYQPIYSYMHGAKTIPVICCELRRKLVTSINKTFGTKLPQDRRPARLLYRLMAQQNRYDIGKTYYGLLPDYDDTPRRQHTAVMITGNKPEYFRDCLDVLYHKSEAAENEFVFTVKPQYVINVYEKDIDGICCFVHVFYRMQS